MKKYTIGQIINYTKNLLVNDYLLKSIYVTGEISNCKYHSMGHIYFSLKDETGSMPAVMFKGNRPRGLKFVLQDGQAVVMKCSIGMYEKTSSVQLYATEIILAEDKEGKLNAEFLKLKEKLYNEGLFDFEVKKKIPQYAKNIGIVTAPTGAAIQDIINVAKRRNPYVQLILYPAKVQGEGAAETIVKGIKALDKMGLDIIIVGRGGGSIEDLWAFNEEIVARAIYEASTPIISGTGHEIDNTIADYVADLRAPTPSAAAEIAAPSTETLYERIDALTRRAENSVSARLERARERLSSLNVRLTGQSPENRLKLSSNRIENYTERNKLAFSRYIERLDSKLCQNTARLESLSPLKVLSRGYSLVYSDDKLLGSSEDISEGDRVKIRFGDGGAEAEIIDKW